MCRVLERLTSLVQSSSLTQYRPLSLSPPNRASNSLFSRDRERCIAAVDFTCSSENKRLHNLTWKPPRLQLQAEVKVEVKVTVS
ncbi:hypothetical protein INR49_020354, partial [Caranx melampygus]